MSPDAKYKKTNAGEDVEEKELLRIVGRNKKISGVTVENQMDFPQNTKDRFTL